MYAMPAASRSRTARLTSLVWFVAKWLRTSLPARQRQRCGCWDGLLYCIYMRGSVCVCVCVVGGRGGVSVAPLMELALAVGLRITNFGGFFYFYFLTEQV